MQCREFEEFLEQQAAEPLPAAVQAHLGGCANCRTLRADLEAIHAAARGLEAEVEPPERVWLAVRGRLESERLIRRPHSVGGFAGWFAWVPRPALAGAFLSVLLVVAIVASIYSNRGVRNPASPLDTHPGLMAVLNKQLNTVQNDAVPAVHPHDPAVVASLHQNLQLVDNYIALCKKSVEENPHDQLSHEYLMGAYQQKAELLAAMTDRGATGD